MTWNINYNPFVQDNVTADQIKFIAMKRTKMENFRKSRLTSALC